MCDSALPVASIEEFIRDTIKQQPDGDYFIVIDESKIQERFKSWTRNFPHIEPFFALKAQHLDQTMKVLAAQSCGFDVASLHELQSVLEAGCLPRNVVFAQPYKQPSHLRFALERGIVSMADSVDEIVKIGEMAALLKCIPPKLVIRILPEIDETETVFSLSSKFGASLKLLPALAQAAKERNVTIVGISFHVGCHCYSSSKYRKTLQISRLWWDRLREEFQFPLEILDIGGGFPGESATTIETLARGINDSISEIYGDIREDIRIIAEPGRYMVASSGYVVAQVIAEKHYDPGMPPQFVINTGVYGALMCNLMDPHQSRVAVPYVIRLRNELEGNSRGQDIYNNKPKGEENGIHEKKILCSGKKEVILWGPTCDSVDRLVDGYYLDDVTRGDWIVFPDHGAYTTNISTAFNGFPSPKIYFVRSKSA